MEADPDLWKKWAQFLHHWGLDGITAFLMEAGGPLSILAAQAIYMGQPFLRQSLPEGHLQALASLFEDREQRQTFATFLREGRSY